LNAKPELQQQVLNKIIGQKYPFSAIFWFKILQKLRIFPK
jgi:hypothetical protein